MIEFSLDESRTPAGPLGLFRASWRRRGGVAAAHMYALVIAPICDVIEFCFSGADGRRGLSRAVT